MATPLQCSCLENPRDQGAWWAAVYGVAQNWTRLKRLSSSSSSKVRVWDRWSLGPLIVNIHESPKKQRTQTKSMFWFHFLSVLFHLSPLWRLYFNGVTRRYLLCICLYCVFAVYYLLCILLCICCVLFVCSDLAQGVERRGVGKG